MLSAGAVAAAAITGNYAFLSGTGGRLPNGGSWWSSSVTVVTSIAVTGAAVAVIVLLAAWLSSAAGKRLAVLYAGLTAALEVLIVCAPAVVIYRAWRRPRPLGSSSGEGLA